MKFLMLFGIITYHILYFNTIFKKSAPLWRTLYFCSDILQLRACCNKCLACLVGLILLEVLDETLCKILCLGLPLGSVGIGISRIEDLGGNARKLCRYLEIEVRDLLGRCVLDVTV